MFLHSCVFMPVCKPTHKHTHKHTCRHGIASPIGSTYMSFLHIQSVYICDFVLRKQDLKNGGVYRSQHYVCSVRACVRACVPASPLSLSVEAEAATQSSCLGESIRQHTSACVSIRMRRERQRQQHRGYICLRERD